MEVSSVRNQNEMDFGENGEDSRTRGKYSGEGGKQYLPPIRMSVFPSAP